jgi:hypothetical protein
MRGHVLEVSTKQPSKLEACRIARSRSLPSDFETLLASIGLVVDNDKELKLPRRDRDR